MTHNTSNFDFSSLGNFDLGASDDNTYNFALEVWSLGTGNRFSIFLRLRDLVWSLGTNGRQRHEA